MKRINIALFLLLWLLSGCGQNTTKYSDANVSGSSVQDTKILQDVTYSREAGIDGDPLYFIAPASGYYRITVSTEVTYESDFYFSVKTETEEREIEEEVAYVELEKEERVDIRVIYDRFFISVAPYTITVTPVTTISEGSVAEPIELALELTYHAQVGISAIGGDSYYQFTSEEAGNYAITASTNNVDVNLFLYQRSSFDYPLEYGGKVLREVLDANTTYYLKVSNGGVDEIQFSLQITKEDKGNEGEIGDPVILTPDLTHRGKIGLDDWNEENSYYQFTTEANVSMYVISLLKVTSTDPIYFSIYGDSSFENRLSFTSSAERVLMELEPSRTYYLKVNNFFGNDAIEYDLTLAEPEGTMTITDSEYLKAFPVALQADMQYKAHVDTLSGNGTESFYAYTAGSDLKPILIAFSDSDDLDLYIYRDADYSEEIAFSYSSPYLLSDPEPGKKYYIKILNYTNSESLAYSLLIQPDP